MASVSAIQQLTERANKLEANNKRRRLEEQLTMEKVVGFGSAGVASVVAGYLDGKFDMSDGEAGNGTTVLGIPVMPVAAGVLTLGGLWFGGAVGSGVAYAGLGVGCGWGYSAGARQGAKSA